MFHKCFLLFLVLFLAAVTLGATVYKWIDEKGVTHYSETPPAAERRARKIEVQPASSATDDEGGKVEGKSWQQKEQEFQKRQAEREEARKQEEAAEAATRRDAKIREERCAAAKQNLDTLLIQRPVYLIDEKGERVYLDDPGRAAEIARMKNEIETYCKPR